MHVFCLPLTYPSRHAPLTLPPDAAALAFAFVRVVLRHEHRRTRVWLAAGRLPCVSRAPPAPERLRAFAPHHPPRILRALPVTHYFYHPSLDPCAQPALHTRGYAQVVPSHHIAWAHSACSPDLDGLWRVASTMYPAHGTYLRCTSHYRRRRLLPTKHSRHSSTRSLLFLTLLLPLSRRLLVR